MPSAYWLMLPMILASAIISGTGPKTDKAAGSVLLVANKGDQTLGIINPESRKQVAAIAEGGVTGHEVIASPDGRFAYVPIYGNSGVGLPGTDGKNLVVVDIASRKIVGDVDFGHGVRPHCPMFGPTDGLLYVTTELDQAVTVIDPRTLKIVGSIPTSRPESHMLALSHDGRYGYTANVGSGTVSVLDLSARKTVDVISVAPTIQRISLSPDDRLAFTSDQTKPQLAVIDTDARKVSSWVPLPATGYGTAATPDGKWLVVAMPKAGKVGVLSLKTMKLERAIDVPAAPQEVLIPPDGAVAYVSCDASHKVAAIRTSDWSVAALIDAGPSADGLAWAVQK